TPSFNCHLSLVRCIITLLSPAKYFMAIDLPFPEVDTPHTFVPLSVVPPNASQPLTVAYVTISDLLILALPNPAKSAPHATLPSHRRIFRRIVASSRKRTGVTAILAFHRRHSRRNALTFLLQASAGRFDLGQTFHDSECAPRCRPARGRSINDGRITPTPAPCARARRVRPRARKIARAGAIRDNRRGPWSPWRARRRASGRGSSPARRRARRVRSTPG